MLHRVCAWLVVRQSLAEQTQRHLLARQGVQYQGRRCAFDAMSKAQSSGVDKLEPGLLDLFRERVDYTVEAAPPGHEASDVRRTLERLAKDLTPWLDEEGTKAVAGLVRTGDSGASMAQLAQEEQSLFAEMEQEHEQELFAEQEEEKETWPEQAIWVYREQEEEQEEEEEEEEEEFVAEYPSRRGALLLASGAAARRADRWPLPTFEGRLLGRHHLKVGASSSVIEAFAHRPASEPLKIRLVSEPSAVQFSSSIFRARDNFCRRSGAMNGKALPASLKVKNTFIDVRPDFVDDDDYDDTVGAAAEMMMKQRQCSEPAPTRQFSARQTSGSEMHAPISMLGPNSLAEDETV
eukprot:s13_g24.t1